MGCAEVGGGKRQLLGTRVRPSVAHRIEGSLGRGDSSSDVAPGEDRADNHWHYEDDDAHPEDHRASHDPTPPPRAQVAVRRQQSRRYGHHRH